MAERDETPFTLPLWRALRHDPRTSYAIAKEAGIDKSTLSRFEAGFGIISNKIIDRLLPVLGLELTPIEKEEANDAKE